MTRTPLGRSAAVVEHIRMTTAIVDELHELLQQAVDEYVDLRAKTGSPNLASEFSAGYAKGLAAAVALARRSTSSANIQLR